MSHTRAMARLPLYYTFGNHMHWVDMEWLWGYHVLPGSVRDMLRFCQETGAKGNVNFEGIGYEKLAAEDPSALAELKAAVQEGTVEPVGCSYGQPYGLFHGGESNVRQRVYGVRTALRLLGTRPRTFWEEEFDFFPQLPQMLRGVGFSYASLFFQWTWHTPEVPKEEVPVVWWEGQDGSRLLCATRNKLNLHQWPEDMEITFSSLSPDDASGLVLQWLELMPSPDWMCRSEVLLPKMKELLSDERFEIKMATLGGYLGSLEGDFETRRYTMDDVWHGMSLGKNGDYIRRLSQGAEKTLLAAETVSAINGLFGRPYAQWDVYPTWELEEAWRELLSAQHHDNDECEGLCGHVGIYSYERSRKLARHVLSANIDNLARRFAAPDADFKRYMPIKKGKENLLVINPLGWEIEAAVGMGRPGNQTLLKVPAFGCAVIKVESAQVQEIPSIKKGEVGEITRGDLRIDASDRHLRQIRSAEFPEGALSTQGAFSLDKANVAFGVSLSLARRALSVKLMCDVQRLDPGMNAGLQANIHLNFRPKLVVDHPYGVSECTPIAKGLKKYPEGDWMTSPQWFEEVHRPFTALTFVDLIDADNPDRGLLIAHDGSQQWFLDEEKQSVRCLLSMYDPWDEDYFRGSADAHFQVIPHGPITNSQRWKLAQEFLRPVSRCFFSGEPTGPSTFSALSCSSENVLPTAFYRETEDYSGRALESYAGRGMGYPYVVRLVEFDGVETSAKLTVAGTVVKAYKTNLLGEIETELSSRVADAKSEISLNVKPFEIVTLYLDIVEGRKQTRDLDAKREIWATVHRVEE